MKIALPITLAIGCLSLLISLLAAFAYYLVLVSQSQNQVIASAAVPNFAESVASSQDFATLKRGCHVLAQTLDANIDISQKQSDIFEHFTTVVTWFAFVWGLVCGSMLLYVHFLLRRVAKNHGL